MDLTADLLVLQAEAESRMVDTCVATVTAAGSGEPVLDESGWPTTPAGTVVYAGKCRIRMGGTVSGSSSREVAEDRVFMSQPVLSVPVSAPTIPVGAVVVLGSTGLRMRVVGRVLNTQATAQRVTVEVVTG